MGQCVANPIISYASLNKELSNSKPGTVPIFAQRKRDCPLPETVSYSWTSPKRWILAPP